MMIAKPAITIELLPPLPLIIKMIYYNSLLKSSSSYPICLLIFFNATIKKKKKLNLAFFVLSD